jgi:hypothetical protein
VFDVTDPANPALADAYDTSAYAGDGYDGAFGVYPYAPSGNIYVTDHPNGLYVFGVERTASTASTPAADDGLSGYPNPFNPSTTIAWDLARTSAVALSIYDARGRRVRTLVHGRRDAGHYETEWDGTGDGGQPLASGVYFCRLATGGDVRTLRLTLVK